MRQFTRLLALAFLVVAAGALPARAQSYHVTATFKLGGDGGWDYIALDTAQHRLFIARQDRIMVVAEATGALLGEIPGLNRAHGVAFAYGAGHGFATSGADSAVTMFDLATLAVLGKTTAAIDDDGILFDPATGRIFTMNGDAGSATAIDAVSGQRIGSVDLGGKPEFGVSAADGKLYVNLEDKSEVVEVDAAAMKVLRHWSIAPCESPSGLAIDRAHHRLFSGCRNGLMGVSDAVRGRLVTTVPIGRGVDANRFDPATQLAFASNGDGTLTVIHEDGPDKYTVVSNAATKQGARTMEIDLASHRVFTVTADFGPAPAPTPERPRPRPTVVPGTFSLLVLEP
ncbi:MAG: YncE family protein [Gemmatimonadales bacterium]|jgi:DNA-binding beta-propeller fold protein YncE